LFKDKEINTKTDDKDSQKEESGKNTEYDIEIDEDYVEVIKL